MIQSTSPTDAPAPPETDPGRPRAIAAIDLGSNSFHMIVAEVVGGEPVVRDRLREQVQIRAGLDQEKSLTPEATARALACLERFGHRIDSAPGILVRAVGTNALRSATNARPFLREAERVLGHPIEIVSGPEEARLIYLGVSHSTEFVSGNRLVLDIGGGSTECILGEGFDPIEMHSIQMGCIESTQRFFRSGKISRSRFDEAVLAARRKLYGVERRLQDHGWSNAVGASGTIRATEAILRANDWSHGGITADGLERLAARLLEFRYIKDLRIPGLKSSRAPIFPGGLAILCALFRSLAIETMATSGGALREGLLYDSLGRIRHEDVRARTIGAFEERYRVDSRHADRVERTALGVLGKAARGWGLADEESSSFLTWATRIHEIGLTVSHRRHQCHAAYIVGNADMPGFSADDQEVLAALVLNHRKRVYPEAFERLAPRWQKRAAHLATLLRLAVLLHRGRSREPLPELDVVCVKNALTISFPTGWLAEHPLTKRDLDGQRETLERLGIELRVCETTP